MWKGWRRWKEANKKHMSNEEQKDECYEAYKGEIIKSNVRKFGEFLRSDGGHHLTMRADYDTKAGREFDLRRAAFFCSGEGSVSEVGEHFPFTSDRGQKIFGSVVFGFPPLKTGRGAKENAEWDPAIVGISCAESASRETKDVLQESAFIFNVARARSPKDLFVALDLYPEKIMTRDRREMGKDYVKGKILDFMEGKTDEEYITSKYGLRDKVIELKEGLVRNRKE